MVIPKAKIQYDVLPIPFSIINLVRRELISCEEFIILSLIFAFEDEEYVDWYDTIYRIARELFLDKSEMEQSMDRFKRMGLIYWTHFSDGTCSLEFTQDEIDIDFIEQIKHEEIKERAVSIQQDKDKESCVSNRIRTQVFERDKYRCQKCGDWHNLALDHIHPRSKGGTNKIENLQTLCKSCNSKKGAEVE